MCEDMQWASVAPSLVVIATQQGQWFLHRLSALWSGGDPFLIPMSEEGTKSTTSALLDGAVSAGVARPGDRSPEPVLLTLPMLVYSLVSSYHTTHQTPSIFRTAARRAAGLGRLEFVNFVQRKATEEAGHDRLALEDLRSLGLPASKLVDALRPHTAATMVQYFEASSLADNPVGCLGYTYCLERLALLRGQTAIEQVLKVSPSGVDPTRFLRVHSALGGDARHVYDLVDFIASLPASDRILITRTAYETAVLMAAHIYQDPVTICDQLARAMRAIGLALPDWLSSSNSRHSS